ncbi:MAG: hypothetical protein WC050_01845 [Candidatus Paceibacterota bacterium]
MIRLRHFHDFKHILDDEMPFPAVNLMLKTAVQMTVRRSREKKGFTGPIVDIDVRLVAEQSVPNIYPEMFIADNCAISVRTFSHKRPTIEMWQLE